MAARVDGLSTLFTAIEPPQPTGASLGSVNQGSAGRDSRGFADHLQQASQPKTSQDDARSSAPSTHSRSDVKRTDSHRKPTNSAANSRPEKTDAHSAAAPESSDAATSDDVSNDQSPVTEEANADVQAVDDVQAEKPEADEETTDESLTVAIQTAQVVVPEVIVAPQDELVVHTEIATAGDVEPVVPASNAPVTGNASDVKADTQAEAEKNKLVENTAVTIDADRKIEQVKEFAQDTENSKVNKSQPIDVAPQATAAVPSAQPVVETLSPIDVASQAQFVAANRTEDKDSEPRSDETTTASDVALQNDVTQVVASTTTAAAAATSTTVVSAVTSTSNSSEGKASQDDSDQTSRETAASDTSFGQDRPVTTDAGIPRHARLALEKLNAHAGKTDETPTLTEAERVRFVQRVANAVHNAVENGGPIRLRLTPPELGAVRIEMRIVEGQMSVRMEAETPQAQATLLDNLPVLRERLEAQDIKIAKFDVDLFGGSNSNLSQSPQRDPNQDAPLPRHQLRRDSATGNAPEPNSVVSRPNLSNDGRLNVLI